MIYAKLYAGIVGSVSVSSAKFPMGNVMRLRIDKRGRIVIPKSLREKLGLALGVGIEAHEEGRGLILRAALRNPALLREKCLLVHQGVPPGRMDWQHIIDALRQERHQ